MPYATQQNLTDRYGEQLLIELTDRGAVATGAIDADIVAKALASADDVINGFLAVRYQLPIVGDPAPIRDLAEAIAIYRLHVYTPSDKIEAEYKDAIAHLERISKGTVKLDLAGIEPETSDGGGARVTDRARPMTAENLKGFV